MKNIFVGLIFVLIDFVFRAGNAEFDILPSFVGFALIFAGARAMLDKNKYFIRIMKLSGIATVYGLCLWGMKALSLCGETVAFIIEIPFVVAKVILMKYVVSATQEIEKTSGIKLLSSELKKRFAVSATSVILTYFVIFFFPVTFVPLEILNNIVSFMYIFTFFQIKNIYYEK